MAPGAALPPLLMESLFFLGKAAFFLSLASGYRNGRSRELDEISVDARSRCKMAFGRLEDK